MKAAKLAIFLLGTLLSSGFAYGSQVLVNGGFETGSISPWANDTRYGTGGWTVTSTGCYAGNYCATDVGDVGLKQTFAGVSTSASQMLSSISTMLLGRRRMTSFTREVEMMISLPPLPTTHGL